MQFMQVLSDLVSLVRGWENSTEAKGTQLLYTVSYDWRRDLFEQAERLATVVDKVVNDTGCKPVVVAHSFGGLITYGAIARFGKEIADKIQGVLYAGSPVQPASPAFIRAHQNNIFCLSFLLPPLSWAWGYLVSLAT